MAVREGEPVLRGDEAAERVPAPGMADARGTPGHRAVPVRRRRSVGHERFPVGRVAETPWSAVGPRRSGAPRASILVAVVALSLSGLLSSPSPAAAAPGALDPSFDGDGRVVTDFGVGDADQAEAVAVQSDGRIVAVGRAGPGFGLARYNPDGALDAAFAGDGTVVPSSRQTSARGPSASPSNPTAPSWPSGGRTAAPTRRASPSPATSRTARSTRRSTATARWSPTSGAPTPPTPSPSSPTESSSPQGSPDRGAPPTSPSPATNPDGSPGPDVRRRRKGRHRPRRPRPGLQPGPPARRPDRRRRLRRWRR